MQALTLSGNGLALLLTQRERESDRVESNCPPIPIPPAGGGAEGFSLLIGEDMMKDECLIFKTPLEYLETDELKQMKPTKCG